MDQASNTIADILYKESKLSVFSYDFTVKNAKVNIQVLYLPHSLMLWIGNSMNTFDDLSLGFPAREKNSALSTKILGGKMGDMSLELSCKLSKKLDKPVYVSYNLADDQGNVKDISEIIQNIIQNHPNG